MNYLISREEGRGLTTVSWFRSSFSISSTTGNLSDGGWEDSSILNILGLAPSPDPNLYSFSLAGSSIPKYALTWSINVWKSPLVGKLVFQVLLHLTAQVELYEEVPSAPYSPFLSLWRGERT